MNHFIFLRHNRRQIGAHPTCPHSPARCVSRIVGHLRAVHHSFRRRASVVDTGAAEIAFLDERHLPSDVRETQRKRNACLSRADYNRVVFHTRGPRYDSIIQGV